MKETARKILENYEKLTSNLEAIRTHRDSLPDKGRDISDEEIDTALKDCELGRKFAQEVLDDPKDPTPRQQSLLELLLGAASGFLQSTQEILAHVPKN